MTKVFEQFQRFALLRGALFIIAGILAIVYPQQFTKAIIYVIAGYVAFLSLVNLYNAYKEKKATGYTGFELIFGVLLMIASLAILALAKPIFTIITIFLGIVIVLNGCTRIIQGFNLKSLNQTYLPWIIYGIILIIGGLVLMFNAVASMMTLFGSIVIFMGISEIISYFQIRKNFV